MKIAIVEDENLAAERLSDLIKQYDPSYEILVFLDSVQEAVAWFSASAPPDLAFFDIQLADGHSFDIFQQCNVNCPVIFTTAYDEYALHAFKVNSIDYLLKPIDLESIKKAFIKLEQLKSSFIKDAPAITLETMQKVVQSLQKPNYKTRFVVKSGAQIHSVQVEDILYFFHEDKIVWLKRNDLKKFAVDFTLEQLETILDPARFFRLNRQFIVAFDAIKEITTYSNSRLKIKLLDNNEPVIVSRERVGDFKTWLGE
ncbi:MAG: LytTR family DNA-binding domain-containing protein [Saprospiraceae bacterium]|nr:LytTR family DNA-binding domain-containing protein [Saprospiraceae bacterium]